MDIEVYGVAIEIDKHRNRASHHEWRLTIDTAEVPGLKEGPDLVDARKALSDIRGIIEDGIGPNDIEPVTVVRTGPRAVTFDFRTKRERDEVVRELEIKSETGFWD